MRIGIKELVENNRVDGVLPVSPATRMLNPGINFVKLRKQVNKTNNRDKKDLFLTALKFSTEQFHKAYKDEVAKRN